MTELTSSRACVDVVVAGAGTGKTFSLTACAQASTTAGQRVLGAALAAGAARELTTTAAFPPTTLTALTARLATVTAGTAVVVDGMIGTRQLGPLLDRAAAVGAKVVLVGDPPAAALDHGGRPPRRPCPTPLPAHASREPTPTGSVNATPSASYATATSPEP